MIKEQDVKYVVYLKQEGEGCDYSIGCGNTLLELKAQSMGEALEEVSTMFSTAEVGEYKESGRFAYSDEKIKRAIVFRVAGSRSLDLKMIYERLSSEKDAIAEAKSKDRDVAEFERLKKKLGK